MSKITIGLNIIMKDEAHVIERLLNTVHPILDWYTVIDTGSTDNSIQIVKDFFAAKGIPGEVWEHPFVDFEDARNFALEKIKGKADFAFMIDCDEELLIDKKFNLHKFKEDLSRHDWGSSMVQYNESRYGRPNFFRTDKGFKWIGKVHEYLYSPNAGTQLTIDGLTTVVHSDGASWADQKQKYLTHAAIFEKEVAANNDPRDVFYLAQSYRDAGENEKSIEWYRKRAAMTEGFFEERYFAQFMVGNLYSKTNKPFQDTLFEWLECSMYDNMKAEHLVNIIAELQNRNRWEAAYIFSKYAVDRFHKKNPYPNRILFLDNSTYENSILNLHIKSCQATGRVDDLNQFRNNMNLDEFFNTIPSAWTGHRNFAEWLVKETKAKIIVDLGVDYGYSTYAFASAKQGMVFGIDLFKGDPQTGFRDNYKFVSDCVTHMKSKYKIDNIKILKGDFNEIAKTWPRTIDILHIDGYHTYEAVKNDFETWTKFLDKDGIVLFHDTVAHTGVTKFFSELDMPKLNFVHSAGLGIASNNAALMARIKELYFPEEARMIEVNKERITIAFIQHDTEVYNKYLAPSLKNLRGDFDIIQIPSTQGMPAELYNTLLEKSPNKYVLLIHEDTTFSPDFLEKINQTIGIFPKFGAIGPVGQGFEKEYIWSEDATIKEVEVFDCCCILINKEHGLKFDAQTFNEYHMYVDDYAMQVQDKGLKCHTIPTHASEAGKDDQYSDEGSYFKHHSQTVRKLGYCWGNYWKYNKLMQQKWNQPVQVDVCILSNAKTPELKLVTEQGIKTLIESEQNIQFNIFVVEGNENVKYDFPNTKTLHTWMEFNYNAYMNFALSKGNAPYVVLCNNDLSYEKNWATNIIKEMKLNPKIVSASPFCPGVNVMNGSNTHVGYAVRKQLNGWCIFAKREVFKHIGKLDEGVAFWFSDNIYADQLAFHGLTHALVQNSVVHHHENNLGVTGEGLDANTKARYTQGQYDLYINAAEKYKKVDLIP